MSEPRRTRFPANAPFPSPRAGDGLAAVRHGVVGPEFSPGQDALPRANPAAAGGGHLVPGGGVAGGALRTGGGGAGAGIVADAGRADAPGTCPGGGPGGVRRGRDAPANGRHQLHRRLDQRVPDLVLLRDHPRDRRLPPPGMAPGAGGGGVAPPSSWAWRSSPGSARARCAWDAANGKRLGASVFFAGQILWLERPAYARNRTAHATLVMFATLAAAMGPVACARGRAGGDFLVAAAGSPVVAMSLLLVLTLGCTLVTFTLMNHWQRHLAATEAGLIYCAEPVWTSLAALVLPAWLAAWAGVSTGTNRPRCGCCSAARSSPPPTSPCNGNRPRRPPAAAGLRAERRFAGAVCRKLSASV